MSCTPQKEEMELEDELIEWLNRQKKIEADFNTKLNSKNMQINTIISDQTREVISIVHPAILHGSGWLNHPEIQCVLHKLGTYTVTHVGQGYAILTLIDL